MKKDKFSYSIIYGVIRPEISERLSVGLIIVDGDNVKVRYSPEKLDVFKLLLSPEVYKSMGNLLRLWTEKNIINMCNIDYLSRYMNNLITFSPLQTIDLEPSQENEDWLYRNYVAITRER